MPQSKGMWIIGFVALVVIAGGIWWWSSVSSPTVAPVAVNNTGNTGTAPSGPTSQNNPGNTGSATPSVGTAPTAGLSQGNSDASLNSDLANVDGQMNGLTSDSANINQGLNDKPVAQSY